MEIAQHDFKYVIQDFSNVYFGGRMTYDDLVENEDVPTAFKRAVHRVIRHETGLETTVEDHLLSLSEDSDSFLLYKQLKVSIEVVFDESDDAAQKIRSRTYTIQELLSDKTLHGRKRNFLIREVHFRKLRLAGVSV